MQENKAIFIADKYVKYRPTYPLPLFDYIYQYVNRFDRVWDCGCGNGQATSQLAEKFKQVIATDIAAKQIEYAVEKPNINYKVCPAEQTSIADNSIDLITVAQALHWFDHTAFALEVKRVLKHKGILAAWGYSPPRINKKIDTIIDYTGFDLLNDYWGSGRKYVDNCYRNIPFPFKKIENHEFYCESQYSLQGLIGYLESWSPRLNYLRKHDKDPLDFVKAELTAAWGNAKEIKTIKWPIFLLLGLND